MSLEVISTINKQKEELSFWKNKLIKNLSINTYITEDLFIISNYWLINYEKYISNFDNEGINPPIFEEKFKYVNEVILGLIPNKDTKIDKLPKVFILNKAIWNNIKEGNEQLNSIMSKGYFSYKIAVLKVFEKIYCFFFLDKNTNIRQGYLQIVDTSKEFQIISDLKNDGIFELLNKDENKYEINDDSLLIKNDNYNLKITEYSDKNEEIDILKLPYEVLKEKAKRNYEKIMKIKDGIKLIAKAIFMELKGKFFSLFKFNEDKNIEDLRKNNFEVMALNSSESGLINPPREIKKRQRNSSVKSKMLKKSLRKLNDGNFELSKFLPPKPMAKLAVPGIIGLKNIGATCYMNATLQCFSNTAKMRAYLLNKDIYNNLEISKDSNKKLSFALAEVIKNLWEILIHNEYSPEHFKNVISEMNPLFLGIKANDPKDLILFLLEKIHKELNKAPKKILKNYYINDTNFNEVFNDFQKNYLNNNQSIITEEFNGYTNSMTTCGCCGTTIHNVQTFNILFFPLEEVRKFMNYKHNNVRIKDCFQYYEKQNIFPSFYCNKCHYLCQSLNSSKLIYAPQTLIINLNRGRGLEYNINIVFDEYLNIREYIFANNSPYYYELTGVICHFGSNDEGGHFIAYCKNSNNCEWYKFNDQFVNKCYFYEVQNANLPYVLFYNYIQV